MKMLLRLLKEEDGATVMEYGLITSLISLAAIGSMVALDARFLALFAH